MIEVNKAVYIINEGHQMKNLCTINYKEHNVEHS